MNWDPVDHTVLANEQVIDGRGWRSGALVEQRELTQWFFKITDYAEELLTGLDTLERWPDKVRLMQRNWIGRSEGLVAAIRARRRRRATRARSKCSRRAPTRCSARNSSPSRRIIRSRKASPPDNPALKAFIDECHQMGTSVAAIETAEKKGFDTGLKVVHPFDDTWLLPVYVANFVLMDYGTGAIFGCPAHDQRDLDFANKYGLGATPVVCPEGVDPADARDRRHGPSTARAGWSIRAFSTGSPWRRPRKRRRAGWRQAELFGAPQGRRKVNYKLRDWGVSRQRYWGCPIPIIHCESCGVVPVPAADLPVKLPEDVTFDQPGNPLDRHPTWKHVACPTCGKPARRETDTMDTFVDSSWYYARFTDPHNDDGAGVEGGARALAAGRSIYRRHRARDPASALFALLRARDARLRPRRAGRALRRPLHPGHGGARDL